MRVVNDDLAGAALERFLAQPQVRDGPGQQVDRSVSVDIGVRANDVEQVAAATEAGADACVGADIETAALAEVDLRQPSCKPITKVPEFTGTAPLPSMVAAAFPVTKPSRVKAVAAMFGMELMVILVSAALRCQPSSVSVD